MKKDGLLRRARKERNISERAWRCLELDGYVEDALGKNFDDEAVAYIVEEFDELAEEFPGGRNRGGRPKGGRENKRLTTERFEPDLDEYEIGRGKAYEEYLAKVVSLAERVSTTRRASVGDPRRLSVIDYREEILGGGTLTPNEAGGFLRSPAAAMLEGDEFRISNIPPVHTTATEVIGTGEDERGFYELIKLSIDPPGMAIYPVYARPGRPMEELQFPGSDGKTEMVSARPLSVLGELSELVDHLDKFTLWEREDITWFVLTGETPPVPPLQVHRSMMHSRHYANREIVLRVSPWVHVDTVAKTYKAIQSQTLGHINQRMGEKNLRLFRFLVECLDSVDLISGDRMPDGSKLVAEWNEMYPDWKYNETKNFWRDFHNAKKSINDPVWKWEKNF